MGSPDPAADRLFAEFVQRPAGSEGEDFERFCREHPEQAAALRELKRSWDRLSGVLERLGPSAPLAARLREEYGAAANPEISLAGEVRPVAHSAIRQREAAKLGFTRAFGPPNGAHNEVGVQYGEIPLLPNVVDRILSDA